jgi:hypothetical protein
VIHEVSAHTIDLRRRLLLLLKLLWLLLLLKLLWLLLLKLLWL